ncbi:hypothetical protein PR048_017258 [Dryococelus australis]|uniref:Uncharacterized protein n=1 Tax=Dryococelus australis TaxID=614101 RepID=A0ABQ9H909_9NEOP|nr:hypothetical protein PR048_017258 [Dryococelus australis]
MRHTTYSSSAHVPNIDLPQGTQLSSHMVNAVGLLNSHQLEPGSIPGRVTPGFLHVGIVPNDAAGQRVFSGISHFPRSFIPALIHTHLNYPHRLSRPRYRRTSTSGGLRVSSVRSRFPYSSDEGLSTTARAPTARRSRQGTRTQVGHAHYNSDHPRRYVSYNQQLMARLDAGPGVRTLVGVRRAAVVQFGVSCVVGRAGLVGVTRAGASRQVMAAQTRWRTGRNRHDGATALLERRSDETLGGRVNVARVCRCQQDCLSEFIEFGAKSKYSMQRRKYTSIYLNSDTAVAIFSLVATAMCSQLYLRPGSTEFRPCLLEGLRGALRKRRHLARADGEDTTNCLSRDLKITDAGAGNVDREPACRQVFGRHPAHLPPTRPTRLCRRERERREREHLSLRSGPGPSAASVRSPARYAENTTSSVTCPPPPSTAVARETPTLPLLRSLPQRAVRRLFSQLNYTRRQRSAKSRFGIPLACTGGIRCISGSFISVLCNYSVTGSQFIRRPQHNSEAATVLQAKKDRMPSYLVSTQNKRVSRGETAACSANSSRKCQKNGVIRQQHFGTTFANQRLAYLGATVAERLARSPPTNANWAQYPAGPQDFRKWESCRTMPLVSGFSRNLPLPPPLHSGAALYSLQPPSSALKTSLLRVAQISLLILHSLRYLPARRPSSHIERNIACSEAIREAIFVGSGKHICEGWEGSVFEARSGQSKQQHTPPLGRPRRPIASRPRADPRATTHFTDCWASLCGVHLPYPSLLHPLLAGPQHLTILKTNCRGEPGSLPGRFTEFSHVGIVPDDAVDRRVFSGSPVSPALSFRCCYILALLTLIGFKDLIVKSRPNLAVANVKPDAPGTGHEALTSSRDSAGDINQESGVFVRGQPEDLYSRWRPAVCLVSGRETCAALCHPTRRPRPASVCVPAQRRRQRGRGFSGVSTSGRRKPEMGSLCICWQEQQLPLELSTALFDVAHACSLRPSYDTALQCSSHDISSCGRVPPADCRDAYSSTKRKINIATSLIISIHASIDYQLRAAVVQWSDCSHPINANRVRFQMDLPLGFSHTGIVPTMPAGRRVFSEIPSFPRSCIPALLRTHFALTLYGASDAVVNLCTPIQEDLGSNPDPVILISVCRGFPEHSRRMLGRTGQISALFSPRLGAGSERCVRYHVAGASGAMTARQSRRVVFNLPPSGGACHAPPTAGGTVSCRELSCPLLATPSLPTTRCAGVEKIWAALNIGVLKADDGEAAGIQGRGNREIPEKTRRTAASSRTIPTCENPGVTSPEIEPGSPGWEASSLTTIPPRPPLCEYIIVRIHVPF